MIRRFVSMLDAHLNAFNIAMSPGWIAFAWLTDFHPAATTAAVVFLMCVAWCALECKPTARAEQALIQAKAALERLNASRGAAMQATECAQRELAAAEEVWGARIRQLQADAGSADEVWLARADVEPELTRLRALARAAEEHHDLVEVALQEYRALGTSAEEMIDRSPSLRFFLRMRRIARDSLPTGLAALAIAVAGQERAHMRDEWLADLAGAPEEGVDIRQRGQVRHALGFVKAALKYRLKDIVRPMWRPVDWLLTVESRTHGFIALGVGSLAIYIVASDGLHMLLTEGWGWCGACGISLFALLRWLRGVRGLELITRQSQPGDE